ncbi:MAG: ATP-grasp domain-containing protein [Hyphomicrobiaceae bacterium]|nr:ATP-grasp domain-containing protein [Hyphomicrobiaceae bacterium]
MTGEPVLIAAYSGRALAASARRAGYRPLVIDAFGDADTLSCADGAVVRVAGAARRGFAGAQVLRAVEELLARSPREPVGLVTGAGFEDRPQLLAALAQRVRLLGCSEVVVGAAKRPELFFPMLADLGIVHPDTMWHGTTSGEGWISKRIGGSGGAHVRRARPGAAPGTGRYVQRHIAGESLSVMALCGRTGPAFAFTRSWTNPIAKAAFRYGGSVSTDSVDADLEARLVDASLAVTRRLGLVGLASLDFIIDADGEAYLIEVNPRPGATLDILDDEAGSLFSAHVAAARGEDAVALLARSWQPRPRASAYVYADAGPLTAPALDWPIWVSDIPLPGTAIPAGAPIVTVHGEGTTATEARRVCLERQEVLSQRLAVTAER